MLKNQPLATHARCFHLKLGLALSLFALMLVGCGGSVSFSPESSAALDGSYAMEAPEAAEEYYEEAASDAAPARLSSRSAKVAAPVMADAAAGDDEDAALTVSTSEPPTAATSERAGRPLLIYTANLGLGVFRVQENLDRIEKMALDTGGYLVSRGQNRVMVRVPAQHFESTVEEVLKLGDVHHREITAQDVTAEYTDLEIRLKNALAMRLRLEELLAKAQDVKEALKVEEQLGRVAEQIEIMKGRLKMLRELTSYSTIHVEFSERSAPIDSRVQLPFPWLDEMGLGSLLRL